MRKRILPFILVCSLSFNIALLVFSVLQKREADRAVLERELVRIELIRARERAAHEEAERQRMIALENMALALRNQELAAQASLSGTTRSK